MNREIKFRGQRVDNGKLVYGDLIHGVNHKAGKTYILPIKGGVMALGHGLDPIDGYEVNPESVGRLIGREDDNCKEIYEGDICMCKTHRDSEERFFGVVEYDNYETAFVLRLVNHIDSDFSAVLSGFGRVRVIGNIYEHPSLLNTKNQ
jgi:uncharacterized phage protein (TIGR01671 family)